MSGKRSFGSIRKLKSGRFQARFTAPNGAVITAPRTFAAKIHAETWLGDVTASAKSTRTSGTPAPRHASVNGSVSRTTHNSG